MGIRRHQSILVTFGVIVKVVMSKNVLPLMSLCQRDISRTTRPISIIFGIKVPVRGTPALVDFGDLGVIVKVVTSENVLQLMNPC